MPNKFQKIADPGVWIIFVLIILLVIFGFYSFYKNDGGNDKLGAFIDEVGDVFNNINTSVDSTNIYDNSNLNKDSNTNTIKNVNTVSNINISSNINKIDNINYNENSIFEWKDLTNENGIFYSDYNLKISLQEVDTSSNQAFINFNYSDYGEIYNYNGTENYPINTNMNVNLNTYLNIQNSYNLKDYANNLYRTHYYCDGSLDTSTYPSGREFIDLRSGYSNYKCNNRSEEQCDYNVKNDTYYDDKCDYENVNFYEGYVKCLDNLVIAVQNITENRVEIGFAEKKANQSCMDFKIN